MRTFLAVDLSSDLKKEAAVFVESVKQLCRGFRFIPPENWHMTLHFFGEISERDARRMTPELDHALREVNGFQLSLSGFGAFPSLKSPRVLWVGVDKGATELIHLKEKVDQSLKKLNVSLETRPFHPHVTIARVQDQSREADLSTRSTFHGRVIDQVNQVVLYQSELTRSGARYHSLFKFPLANPR